MTEAESLVQSIDEIGHGGRVSKSAVRGILGRVYLTMAGYPLNDRSKLEEARKVLKTVIEGKEYRHSLNPDYNQVFINYAQDKYDIGESIWEVNSGKPYGCISGNRDHRRSQRDSEQL